MSGFEQAVAETPAASFNPAETPAVQPQVTQVEDGSIVVNGKVYKPEAAAKKIEHADTHIQTLEQENAKNVSANLALLDRIEALEKGRNQADALDKLVTEAAQAAPVAPPIEPSPTQEISREDLVNAAAETAVGVLKAEQVANQQEANLNACIALAQTAHGDAWGTKIDALGEKHRMPLEEIMDMARNQPTVFKALYIPTGSPSGSPDTGNTVNGDAGQGAAYAPVKQKSYMRMSNKERIANMDRRYAALSNET